MAGTSPLRGTGRKPFTVSDEIGVTLFNPLNGKDVAIRFSPDRRYFAVWSERGRLDLNRVENSLRVYQSQDVERFLTRRDSVELPKPVWVITRYTEEADRAGSPIAQWRWLRDSAGLSFIEHGEGDSHRLVYFDIMKGATQALTPANQNVTAYDMAGLEHIAYTVSDRRTDFSKPTKRPPVTVATGASEERLFFPDDPATSLVEPSHQWIWFVAGSRHFQIMDRGVPVGSWADFSDIPDLVISPDGRYLVTTLPVADIPAAWDTLYPPPYPSYPHHFRPGAFVHQYSLVDLDRGSVSSLTNAPVASDVGWHGYGSPQFSSNGKFVVLPGSFSKDSQDSPARPCVEVVEIASQQASCVVTLNGDSESGETGPTVTNVGFVDGDERKVIVSFFHHSATYTKQYQCGADDKWNPTDTNNPGERNPEGLKVFIKQNLDQPPLLIAKSENREEAIWDPNPQFATLDLAKAEVYTWKDKNGKELTGGLYTPSNYSAGQRYPLVIQTHGFAPMLFSTSGGFSTGSAARALAASGILVLQMGEQNCPMMTTEEGTCTVSRYQSAIDALVADGHADPNKVGIVGFSHTCFGVMKMLTNGSFHLRAALMTDGVMMSYMQYLITADDQIFGDNEVAKEFDATIGARPFGDGLKTWLRRSPTFNVDRVDTPLIIFSAGPDNLLSMWEPYAALRYLHKPVELIMLNSGEHVLTNPAMRLASQGGSVDWFRFWLQNYEDPDSSKVEQYKRWRDLRTLQELVRQKRLRESPPQSATH
jgi:hypothetical protein